MSLSKDLTAAAGNAAAGDNLYVEDVFSTYLYEGTGSALTITNGINLDEEGGLVWLKDRSQGYDHGLFDTARGAGRRLRSNSTDAENASLNYVSSFNADGFSIGAPSATTNTSGDNYASWTFRKAEKFFDVVTYAYQGNSVGTSAEIPHNLGSAPAFIMIKAVDKAENFICWHKDLNGYLKMGTQGTDSLFTGTGAFGSLTPSMTDTHFTVGYDGGTNFPNYNYVAYLFAPDAGGFGDDGSENIIKCGSYTGNGTNSNYIDFGFEPQWLLVKNATNGSTPWLMIDNMRGWPAAPASSQQELIANGSNAESTGSNVGITSTGIGITTSATPINASGSTYIYIAIRRPMKTPESGTEVFATAAQAGGGTITTGFPTDLVIEQNRNGSGSTSVFDRLRSFSTTAYRQLNIASTAAENVGTSYGVGLQSNTQVIDNWYGSGSDIAYWMFKRATGFFDVVAYTGTGADGTQSTTLNHNLAATPELMICKRRNGANGWISYHKDLNGGVNPQEYYIYLDRTQGSGGPDSIAWGTSTGGGVAPTSTEFTVGAYNDNGSSGNTYIAYLFATLAGVSKVGSYTGTGSNVDVDCGFSAGARFVLIKRTDATGDWYTWDSTRGIVAGNDPYLLLNSTAAEVTSTDYIDPLASGFTVTSGAPTGLNASGGNYIFLAIA